MIDIAWCIEWWTWKSFSAGCQRDASAGKFSSKLDLPATQKLFGRHAVDFISYKLAMVDIASNHASHWCLERPRQEPRPKKDYERISAKRGSDFMIDSIAIDNTNCTVIYRQRKGALTRRTSSSGWRIPPESQTDEAREKQRKHAQSIRSG